MNDVFKCIVYIFCQSEGGLPKLRFDIVTHVNYAFAIPTRDGHVLPLENPELARAVIAKAHAAGAKVCVSLGGWSYEDVPLEDAFREGTDTPEKIASMAEEIAAMAVEFGFDGPCPPRSWAAWTPQESPSAPRRRPRTGPPLTSWTG